MGFDHALGPAARACPAELADPTWEHFDHGTQRAILKLYRSAPPEVLARAGERLDRVRAPALVLWGTTTPTSPAVRPGLRPRRSADGARARGGRALAWLDRPELVERVGGFLVARSASLLPPCSGPRSPQSRRRLAAVRRGRARHPPLRARGRRSGRAPLVPAHRLVAARAGARRAAVRDRLPDLAAAHGRPRRPHLPRRPVRRRRASRSGTATGTAATTRRPTASSSRRSPGSWAAAGAGASPRVAAAALFEPLARGTSAPSARLGLALVRRRHGHPALHRPAAVPVRRGVRAGRAAGAAATPLRARGRLRRPVPARQPGRRAFPRAGRRGLRAGRARRPRQRREGLAIAAAAFIPPVFLSWAFPEGGLAPFPFTAYLPIPLFALACLSSCRARTRRCAGRGPVRRSPRPLALPDRHADGGQRRAARRALRRPVLLALWFRPWARRPLAAAAAGRRAVAALGFWQWSPAVRDVIKYLDDPAAKSATTSRCATSSPGARPAAHRDPVHARHWEGAEVALREAARARLAAPARHRAQPALLRRARHDLTYASWLAENAVRYVALPSASRTRLVRRARADRARPALPAAALALRGLAGLRGDAAHARS